MLLLSQVSTIKNQLFCILPVGIFNQICLTRGICFQNFLKKGYKLTYQQDKYPLSGQISPPYSLVRGTQIARGFSRPVNISNLHKKVFFLAVLQLINSPFGRRCQPVTDPKACLPHSTATREKKYLAPKVSMGKFS